LATDERIKELEVMLQGQVKLAAADDDDDDITLADEMTIPTAVDWEEGTEDLRSMLTDDAWNYLGLGELKAIPGFNAKIDPDGAHNQWDQKDKAWFEDQNNGEDLKVNWHQQIGIVRLLQLAFSAKKHALLADEVLMCMLRFFREYYDKHKKFPGAFGEWLGLHLRRSNCA
jgi:hypothetical protein